MSTRIVQFGTSRFLQAHVDLFVHEAREVGQDIGPIAVVQASGSAARAGRVSAFGRPEGYPVIIRGMVDGAPVEREVTVRAVDRGLSAAADWAALAALFAGEAELVVSNMGDAGYVIADADRGPALLAGGVPASFPGKLTALLHHRWTQGGAPIKVLPCELINRNGEVLKAAVKELAAASGAPAAFADWLDAKVIFGNTLVDRIVSEPIEPVGAVAEPYALWAIEAQPGLTLPFSHPDVVLTDDLEPFERLKLHILNLGHTFLADIWAREGRPATETVRAILADDAIRARLDALYADEVVPGFAARGMESEARAYVAVTLDRFRNPFLDHRIADIAQNHTVKVERRVKAFLDWIAGRPGAPATPTLDALVARRADGVAA
ncbi:mannitol dehydrogenase family protein [Ancylobacter sonchi]|uniref:mannitol dehydrogenase family protein n=1 Tax=Ancylobacter sonchi TaxID=1937790 RepID=UPI001BD4A21E|nr:mannitol dehydrogenase family protein [Ancylobacter sonchi]MBS7535262.1 mannitol dehydrogenase family protein [Ancylobacter sonchi]